MKLFNCQHCRQLLYFENTRCERCGHALGYLPDVGTLSALEPDGDAWRALANAAVGATGRARTRQHGVCNWLVPADSTDTVLHRLPPQPHHPRPLGRGQSGQPGRSWRPPSVALFYTLLKLGLPMPTEAEDPAKGLTFAFMGDPIGARARRAQGDDRAR